VAALLLALTLLVPSAAHADPGTITGSVSDFDDNPLGGVTVDLVNAGSTTGAAVVSATSVADGTFSMPTPPPNGGGYWVRYSKDGFGTTFLDNGVVDGPVAVTVAGGQLSAPDLDVSDNDLGDVTLRRPAATVKTPPALSGKLVVGQTVSVSAGTWTIATDPDYLSVDWFLDGVDASEFSDGAWFQKFDVPAEAAGRTLTYLVTVEDPDGERDAATYSGTAGVVAKANGTLTGAVKGKQLTVQLTVPGLSSPDGSVVVKDRKKVIGTVALKAKGKGKFKLPKLKPGKHKLTLTYTGTAGVAPATATVKLTVAK